MNDRFVVSFDLDFTLIDNREGILNSFHHAFESCRVAPIETSVLEKTIGEPLYEVFSRLTDKDPNKLIEKFRNYYRREGIYQVKLYDQVMELLQLLKKKGIILGVVTSKKRELAIKLLKHLNIFQYFDFVHGESDKIQNKTDPNLKQFFYSTFPPRTYNYVIVGDHKTDKQLAEMLECPFIGVLTGLHSDFFSKNRDSSHVEIISHIGELNIDLLEKLIKSKVK